MNLDIRTIVVISSAASLVSLVVIIMLWRQARSLFAGTHYWVWDYGLQMVSMLLIALRGYISDWFSMVLANAFIAGALLAMYEGLCIYYGLKWPRKHNYVLVACFIAIQWYFSIVNPYLIARNYNLSVIIVVLSFQSLLVVVKAGKHGQRNASWLLGLSLTGFCLAGLARVATYSLGYREANDYFQSGMFEALMLSIYLIFNLLTTYSLVLLINQRLNMVINEQETILAAAFRTAPYLFIITDADDRTILDINAEVVNVTGYTKEELLSHTTKELAFWVSETDRENALSIIATNREIKGQVYPFRKKNGDVFYGLFNAEYVLIKERRCILSSIADVTDLHNSQEELTRQMAGIKAMNNAMLDREDRIRELKRDLNELSRKLGLPTPYPSQEDGK